jgi:hypothetical protein
MSPLVKNISVVTLFAIAMALLESAVVIYLREIMYPDGFRFPLAPVLPHLLLTEILREAATLVMLVCIGLLAGKRFSEKFAWFIYSFAVWDIFYYVFLWVLSGWPESLMTWDVLFLIPATWTGPVVSPLILTLIMILFAWFILSAAEQGKNTRIKVIEWAGLSAGSGIVVTAFMTDYLKHMLKAFAPGELLRAGDPRIMEVAQQYVPESFPWLLFTAGTVVILAAVIRFRSRV